MCKWKMLAGNGYKRFGSTIDEAVCAIIKRYSRMYGCLDDTRVKALIYLLYLSQGYFYEKVIEDRINAYWTSDTGKKYKTFNGAYGGAWKAGIIQPVHDIRDSTEVNRDAVFDLWIDQTFEVHASSRCAGRWYEDGVFQEIGGVFTPLWAYDEISYNCYDFDGCYEGLYESGVSPITNVGMFIACVKSTIETIDAGYGPVCRGECTFCRGPLIGVVGSGTCECIELARLNKHLRMDVKLHRFFEKAGMTIADATTEQIRCAVKLLTIKYSVSKFKRNQPKKNTRKAK